MRTVLALVSLFFLITASAQDKGSLARVDIRTNTVCDMCERTLETELLYEKGVKHVDVDLAANIIHIDVDPRKTDVMKLRQAVSQLGYSADDLPPDPEARERLPDCCRKEGCGLPGSPAEPKHD